MRVSAHFPGPRAGRPRSLARRLAALTAATAAAVSGVAALGPATPALAGGRSVRACPGDARVDIPSSQGDLAPAARLAAGFYSGAGVYWPPTTLIACRTLPDLGHPLFRIGTGGCDPGAVPFLIPDGSPDSPGPDGAAEGPPPTWGTFLPPGWYVLGEDPTPGWVAVCWYLSRPAAPGAAAVGRSRPAEAA
ncbi:hypothetical protein I6A84_42095 [Frankia sp. CNm7]|uniref:Uncharacterized protein n=1 Tax=Frankia nepalensis TaxID=1836974 RepID=A0A937RKW2_9ACTN|nr:hypothetical protein [Frankia nepalensis]MBL7495280.1 hypothetical protein [Frankia nepalensis]MBL7515539.1 hypothetical protein [Frankia nepalensis]MBL7524457.1 hypothetical protein [Frankia nepalensis]MBL7627791.1 hypothetical protein [Frankia nepalensis]